jgi:hypothetical protein
MSETLIYCFEVSQFFAPKKVYTAIFEKVSILSHTIQFPFDFKSILRISNVDL